jgi:hypothetical protein
VLNRFLGNHGDWKAYLTAVTGAAAKLDCVSAEGDLGDRVLQDLHPSIHLITMRKPTTYSYCGRRDSGRGVTRYYGPIFRAYRRKRYGQGKSGLETGEILSAFSVGQVAGESQGPKPPWLIVYICLYVYGYCRCK